MTRPWSLIPLHDFISATPSSAHPSEIHQTSLSAEVLGDEGGVDDDDDDRGPRRQRSSWSVYAAGPRVWRMVDETGLCDLRLLQCGCSSSDCKCRGISLHSRGIDFQDSDIRDPSEQKGSVFLESCPFAILHDLLIPKS